MSGIGSCDCRTLGLGVVQASFALAHVPTIVACYLQICLLPYGMLVCASTEESCSCWQDSGLLCTVIKSMF